MAEAPPAVDLVEEKLRKFVAFNRAYNDDGGGGPWTIEGRDYVVDQIWRPLVGYRLVSTNVEQPLCRACDRDLGAIVVSETRAQSLEHAAPCPGLKAVPLIITAVNVPRRSGKTHAILSFALASIFIEKNKRYAYIASAEDQADELIDIKVRRPLARHPGLSKSYEASYNKIVVPGRNSWIEVLPTSFGSITGRGFTGVLVDEARDVDSRPASALMPSIFDCHGMECPRGHGHWQVPEPGKPGAAPPATCPTCGHPTERWYGRLLFASSSGLLEDNPERDWFNDFCAKRIEKPHQNVYVFQTSATINPSVSSTMIDAVSSAFADVPGIADYIAVEVSNKPVRRGEVYVKKHEIAAVVDATLRNETSGTRHAVGFFDTSKTTDKTSLVIVEDDARDKEPPFFRVAVKHMKVWDPRDRAHGDCPNGFVDPTAVESYIAALLPNFVRFHMLDVDTRMMPWAKTLVQNLQLGIPDGPNAHEAFGERVQGFNGGELENSAMYLELLDLIIQRRIRIPDDEELKAELLALRKIDKPSGRIAVVDAGGDKRGRARAKGAIHRDRAMSLAGACLRAAVLKLEMPDDFDSIATLDDELDKIMPASPLAGLGTGRNFGKF